MATLFRRCGLRIARKRLAGGKTKHSADGELSGRFTSGVVCVKCKSACLKVFCPPFRRGQCKETEKRREGAK